jgi:hypothetical protein
VIWSCRRSSSWNFRWAILLLCCSIGALTTLAVSDVCFLDQEVSVLLDLASGRARAFVAIILAMVSESSWFALGW